MRRTLLLARTLPRARLLSTSAASRAPASKSLLDEYGAPYRRSFPSATPLAPLGKDGKEEDAFNRTDRATGLKRRTKKAKAASPPLVDESEEGPAEEEAEAEQESEVDVDSAGVLEISIRRDLARYPDAILLTQVGSFYESYFDQAPLVARLLGIKLTSKLFGRKPNRVRRPFAGFPLSQLTKYVATLVESGRKVVVVEEFREIEGGGGAKERRVARIVTPGTGLEDALVKSDEMSFVLALGVEDGGEVHMAYRDVSTGASFTRRSTLETLRDDLLLVAPKEVVVDDEMTLHEAGRQAWEVLEGEREREGLMLSTASTRALAAHTTEDSTAERVLLSYLSSTLVTAPPPQTTPVHLEPARFMQMDSVTLKSLEIRESLRGGVKGSLLSTVRRTATPGGARLLAERLCSPSTEIPVINARLALVSSFHDLPSSRRYLLALLKSLEDSPRLLQRLYLGRGSPFDLLGLKKTMLAASDVYGILKSMEEEEGGEQAGEKDALRTMRTRLEQAGAGRGGQNEALARAIEDAVDEQALVQQTLAAERKQELTETLGAAVVEREEEAAAGTTDGVWGKDEPWAVRPQFSSALRALHEQLTELRRAASTLESTLQAKYGIPRVTLRTHPKLGPIVHIKTLTWKAIDADQTLHQVQRSKSTRAFVMTDWTQLCGKISKLTTKIHALEGETIKMLVAQVLKRYESLQETAQVLSELDVALGFAELASENGWRKPLVGERTSISIVKGRHPTVEHALKLQGRGFTSNSVDFSHPSAFVHVLTGPNMAGKSTFLRQTALITILAQAGSFVPADSVEMGVVDRVFSRVGARDELDRDRSTFMIEMDEATSILKTATNRSLVLLDELGRGTSPLDGLAIAYAALEHIVHVNRSRTLFATHYHRLGELLGYNENDPRGKGEWEGVEFWCTDVEEKENSVTYRHDVRRGLNDDSAGLIIARLSGMPQRAVDVATELRDRYR